MLLKLKLFKLRLLRLRLLMIRLLRFMLHSKFGSLSYMLGQSRYYKLGVPSNL